MRLTQGWDDAGTSMPVPGMAVKGYREQVGESNTSLRYSWANGRLVFVSRAYKGWKTTAYYLFWLNIYIF